MSIEIGVSLDTPDVFDASTPSLSMIFDVSMVHKVSKAKQAKQGDSPPLARVALAIASALPEAL